MLGDDASGQAGRDGGVFNVEPHRWAARVFAGFHGLGEAHFPPHVGDDAVGTILAPLLDLEPALHEAIFREEGSLCGAIGDGCGKPLIEFPYERVGLGQGEEVAVRNDVHFGLLGVTTGGHRANDAVIVRLDLVDHFGNTPEVVPVGEGRDIGEGVDGHRDGVDSGTGSGEGAKSAEDGSFKL